MAPEPSSFRDPSARVYRVNDRIYRVVSPFGQPAYTAVRDTALFRDLQDSGRLIESREVPRSTVAAAGPEDIVIEHPLLDVISYPYEWPFAALKAAALHHLDLQIDALEDNIVFSDASAYNIQFTSGIPVFIDVTSLRPYREGEPWAAHNQFCVSFLAPLVLQSEVGVPFQAWYRGGLEGIEIPDLASILRWNKYFSPTLLSHIVLPAALARRNKKELQNTAKKRAADGISKSRYSAILQQLRHYISRMKPRGLDSSVWGDYSTNNTYLPNEVASKLEVVETFAQNIKPMMLIDIGCNDGVYSAAALRAGAEMAVGLDMDQSALDAAYARSCREDLRFVPLYMDLANPSPSQGFAEIERSSLSSRLSKADAVIALAVIHHMVIGRNIPVDQAVDWLVRWGTNGIIEFVPKSDPTIQEMLMLRDDIFSDYNRSSFVAALEKHAKIVSNTVISSSGRELFEFHRMAD